MSQENPLPEADRLNLEHDDDSGNLKAVAFGKTTGGAYVEIQVDSTGKLQ